MQPKPTAHQVGPPTIHTASRGKQQQPAVADAGLLTQGQVAAAAAHLLGGPLGGQQHNQLLELDQTTLSNETVGLPVEDTVYES